MTYAIGNLVAASDFNSMRSTLASVYGVGSGDQGYGQTQHSLTALAAGEKITSAQWTNLRNALAVCRYSQTGAVPSLVPPTSVLDAGDLVVAHESSSPTLNAYDIDSEVAAAHANRFTLAVVNTASGSVTGTSSATRAGTWGGSDGGIQLIFDVTWPTTDEARYFFNSGGQIRINLSQPGSSAQDLNWNDALSNRVGQINYGHHGVACGGSLALSDSSSGYFNATGSTQTIFNDVVVGTSPYASNRLRFQHQVLGSASNGGPGNGIRFTIRLIDGHTSSFTDVVSAGTLASFTFTKNSYLANPSITTPSGSVNTAWTAV